MDENKRIAQQVDAMNPLEALYALDMLREYIVRKYQYAGRDNERVRERVEVTDGVVQNA